MQDNNQQGQTSNEPGVVFRPNEGAVVTPTAQPPVQQVVIPAHAPQQPIAQPAPQAQQVPMNPEANISSQNTPPAPMNTEASLTQAVNNENDSYDDQDLNYNPVAPHVAWTASEYLANPKSSGWFMLLGLASVLTAGIVYFVTGRDIVSSIVILVIGLIIGVFSARQPQVLDYSIDNTGFHIGQKFYPYNTFKYFSVVQESNGLGYISLMPLRRFMPPLVIHYDPNDEEKIANTLMEYLPFEDHKPDIVDSIAKRIRF